MTIGLLKGANAMGHTGWFTVKCRICATPLDLLGSIGKSKKQIAYVCPKCRTTVEAYFCHACSRTVKYKCPYCGSKLLIATPVFEE
ncbi:MAG: hypothetical protein QXN05_00415 [Acidilobaceae archaeon]